MIASDYNHSAYGEADKERGTGLSYFITRYSYRVAGVAYHGELRSPEVRILGSKFSIRYDPTSPQYNSVSAAGQPVDGKAFSWLFILAGIVILFFILRYLI